MYAQTPLARLLAEIETALPNILVAIGILIVGWLLAVIVAAVVRRLLQRSRLDDRLAEKLSATDRERVDVESWLSQGVFWLIMLVVLVAFFQQLGLPAISRPLNGLVAEVVGFLPRLAGAAVLLLVAWVVASVVRTVVQRGASAFRLDERLHEGADVEPENRVSVVQPLATAAFWLVILLFLPAVLSTLELEGLVSPVQGMFNEFLGAVPNVFAAAVILLVGWFIARVVRQIVANLLSATGIDRFGRRAGAPGTTTLSGVIATIVYALVLIPAVIAALDALDIAAISEPATNMLGRIMDAVPDLFAAFVVMAIAYLVGRLVADLVARILAGIGFDDVPERLGLRLPDGVAAAYDAGSGASYRAGSADDMPGDVVDGGVIDEGEAPFLGSTAPRRPSEMVGVLVLAGILLFAAIEAADLLGFAALATMLGTFAGFAGRVLLAMVVFAVGLYLANLARDALLSTSGARAGLWAELARGAVLVLVTAMALQEMGIAEQIVNLAFGILLAALGLAAALAFGFGGRDTAARYLDRWTRRMDRAEGRDSA